jgi:hypothetical protein
MSDDCKKVLIVVCANETDVALSLSLCLQHASSVFACW